MDKENTEVNKEGQEINVQEIIVPIVQDIPTYRTKLEKVMKKKGILQKEVALKANIELYQISELCSGKRTNIMLDTAKRICKVLKCKLDDAFGD